MDRSVGEPIGVTVVYAQPQQQWEVYVELPAGASVQTAIERSGLLDSIPELGSRTLEVGIFHRRCAIDAPLRDGDRVEIYRPLQIDPKEARRLRAATKKGAKARGDSGSGS